MKRLFAAISVVPGEEFSAAYRKLQQQLFDAQIKWVPFQNMHLTLKFFGETPDSEIPAIVSVMEEVAGNFGSIPITVRGAGVFGSRYDPRVIWFGIEPNRKLTALGLQLLNRLDEAGFHKDRQNFVPHLTVGRIRSIRDKDRLRQAVSELNEVVLQRQTVTEMVLMESQLFRSGPQYSPVEVFRLNGAP